MRKIIGICCLIIICIGGNLFFIDYLTNKKIGLTEMFVASKDIKSRVTIKESDLVSIWVPEIYINENAITNKENIIGRITSLQGQIPKGSLFFESQLDTINKIPDAAVPLLNKGQIAYTLTANKENLDFSTFLVGQKIDIYFSIQQKNESPIFDELFSNVRIVSIKDRKGVEITSIESSGSAYMCTVAINKEHIQYLSQAMKIGEIEIYSTSNSYSNLESELNGKSKILQVLNTEF